MELSDLELIKFFIRKYDKVEFIVNGDKRKCIKKLLKKIKKNEKELIEIRDKSSYIPKQQQEKIKFTEQLWGLLLKEAIYCLRDEDEDDPNDFKQDFGLIETKKYFNEFSDFEEVLYGSVKYYRDHSLHVIRVFLTGFYLLSESENINFESIVIFGEKKLSKKKITVKEKQAVWALITLTHDLGYPIQKIDEINNKIKQIIKYYGASGIEEFKYHLPLQNQNLNDFILRFISSKLVTNEDRGIEINDSNKRYHTVIQNKYYLKFAKAFEGFSHGIMSCILLMKHLVYFKESDYSHNFLNGFSSQRDAKQFLIRKTILRSIASHDNEDIYHIMPNNFLFLLTFCDELQEWDRPHAEFRFEKSVKIEIDKFLMEEISYTQKHFSESMRLNFEIFERYVRSIKRYIKLFRSGPNSENRPFNFIFILSIYNEDNKDSKKLIEFRYAPNKKPKVIDAFQKEDRIGLVLKYIENNYQKEKGIKKLVENINNNLKSKY